MIDLCDIESEGTGAATICIDCCSDEEVACSQEEMEEQEVDEHTIQQQHEEEQQPEDAALPAVPTLGAAAQAEGRGVRPQISRCCLSSQPLTTIHLCLALHCSAAVAASFWGDSVCACGACCSGVGAGAGRSWGPGRLPNTPPAITIAHAVRPAPSEAELPQPEP